MFSKASTWGITVRPTVTPAIASDTAFSLIIEFMIHGYFFWFLEKNLCGENLCGLHSVE